MTTRMVALEDAAELARVWRANREVLAPFGPERHEDFFTEEGQLEALGSRLAELVAGRTVPHVIVEDGRIVGEVTLSTVVRGAFQSASIGYWLARDAWGRGLATAAVRQVRAVAFDELGLHRLQGEVMPSNLASQRVLERTGFTLYGRAPQYLRIAGRWQEHLLYQCLAPS